jgi:hypothetical protein
MALVVDGTNGISLPTPLAVTSGGTGTATYASGGVLYSSNTANVTSSSSLTFNGSQLSAPQIIAGQMAVNANPTQISLFVNNMSETSNLVAAAINSANVAYLANGAVQYYTTAAGANWVQGITYSSAATINSALPLGQAVTLAVLVTQGGTGYFSNTITIDGTTTGVTTYWQGNTAPSAGHTNCIDVYNYTIIKTSTTPTYTVLATQSQF